MTAITSNDPVPNSKRPVNSLTKEQALKMYKSYQAHAAKGEWEAGLALVNELLKNFPHSQDLLSIHAELSAKIPVQPNKNFTRNPLYRAAMRHFDKKQWAAGLALLDRLVMDFPHEQELTDLKVSITRRARHEQSLVKRRYYILVLILLSMAFVAVAGVFARYLWKPASIADLIVPQVNLKLAPHYLFSIYGVDQPMGVGISPQSDRIYVTEMGGSRLVKIFDSKGSPVGSFEIPHTSVGERAPVYLATDINGYVYVSDRKQHAVYIFDRDGGYINTMLAADLMLSDYVKQHSENQIDGKSFSYNVFQNTLFYQTPDGNEASQKLPFLPEWSPLGVRSGADGSLFLTDVTRDKNSVYIFSPPVDAGSQADHPSNPSVVQVGTTGQGNGEFMFPNSAVTDSQGRVFVADSNNGRISVWDHEGKFLYHFGRGAGDDSLSLPRGIFIDQRDRLFVVDAVGQNVKVFDVSGSEPVFLYAFGDFGLEDGLFNYPNDIAVDQSGRIYIVDRENNRIQVWSF